MLRTLLPLATLGACSLVPDPPHELPFEARTFAVGETNTAVVTEFDPLKPDNIELEGTEIPGQTDANGAELELPLAIEIALGRRHACLVTPERDVHCWGDHTGGALGESRACLPPPPDSEGNETGGEPDCILAPDLVPSLPPVRALAAGDDFTCATTMDDLVLCWGDRSRTAGSRVPVLDPPTPVRLPDGEPLLADRVLITRGSACAIDRAQRLWCWGDAFGNAPAQQPGVGVIDVAIGRRHRCVIDDAGLRCQGDNRNGQIDLAHAEQCGDGKCVLGETTMPYDATRVVVGERHTCVLERSGSVVCMGSNEVGQLGRDNAFLVGEPGEVLDAAIDIKSGYAHTCAHRSDASVWCWGSTSVTVPEAP